MRTALILHQTPFHITEPIPCRQRNPILCPNHLYTPSLRPQTWRLNANAKGFSGAPANTGRPKRKETITRENLRRNEKDDDDDKIPEVVWGRIISRILFYVGVPLGIGLVLLQVFSVVKQNGIWDVPIWVPFISTLLTFGASALGIAYGTLSTSWDAEKEGSLLGFEQAQKNWVEMWKEDEQSNK